MLRRAAVIKRICDRQRAQNAKLLYGDIILKLLWQKKWKQF